MSARGTATGDATLEELHELRRRLYALEKRLEGGAVSDELPDDPFDVLLCRIGEDPVALALADVEEVVPIARMSSLPEAPPWVCGLLHVRHRAVPVLDVLARVQRRARRPALSDLVIVCHAAERSIGLVVQEVHDVHRLDPAELGEAAPDMPHGPYVLGAFHLQDRMPLLFSVPRLLATSDVPVEDAPVDDASAEPLGSEGPEDGPELDR